MGNDNASNSMQEEKMRCTNNKCRSEDTRLLTRTCVLSYDDAGNVIGYKIYNMWLCWTCGNPFYPMVEKVVPAIVRKPSRKGITQEEIVREMFRQ